MLKFKSGVGLVEKFFKKVGTYKILILYLTLKFQLLEKINLFAKFPKIFQIVKISKLF